MSAHLNDDQLVHVLYELGTTEQVRHLKECGHCEQRQLHLAERRRAQTAIRPVTTEMLRQQREAVLMRAASGGHSSWKVPALAASALAAALMVGVFVTSSPQEPLVAVAVQAPVVDDDDADLSELLSVEYAAEAQAALPLRGLFETVSDK